MAERMAQLEQLQGYGLDILRIVFNSWQGDYFVFSRNDQTGSGAHSASYSRWTKSSFPWVKWPQGEADRLLPFPHVFMTSLKITFTSTLLNTEKSLWQEIYDYSI